MKSFICSFVLAVMVVAAVPTSAKAFILFSDDFESGLGQWDTSFLNVGTSSLASKPGFGKHAFLTGYIFNRNAYMFTSVDTRGYEDIALNFWANSNYADDVADDFLWGYSLNGTDWVKEELNTRGWEQYSFALPESTSNVENLYIGFQLKSTGNWNDIDFGKVDSLTVSGEGANVVPEPATMVLFGIGLAGAAIRKRILA